MTFDTEHRMILEMTEEEFKAVKMFATFLNEYAEQVSGSTFTLLEIVDNFTYQKRESAVAELRRNNVELVVRGE